MQLHGLLNTMGGAISGEGYPMEIHLVHQNDKGAIAVIGVMFEQGAHNEILDRLPSFRIKRDQDPDADPVDCNVEGGTLEAVTAQ